MPRQVRARYLNDVDPYDYQRGNFPRRPVVGVLAAVLRPTRLDRALKLIKEKSRCIRSGDIHEVILTDEHDPQPGGGVNRVAYLGFVEFVKGGVIVQGDRLTVGGEIVAELVGFDETHMPNHMNIVVRGGEFISGYERGFRLGDEVVFATPLKDYRGLSPEEGIQ